jgi:hypothetical protein
MLRSESSWDRISTCGGFSLNWEFESSKETLRPLLPNLEEALLSVGRFGQQQVMSGTKDKPLRLITTSKNEGAIV